MTTTTAMPYGRLAAIERPLSRVVQGTTMLGTVLDEDASFALLDRVVAAGGTTFDTAHVYGNGRCEIMLGRWLQARGVRDEVVLLGKGAHHSAERQRVTPADITADLHESLERLQTDHVDLYLLHRERQRPGRLCGQQPAVQPGRAG
jgi:aryl-alcohol dehydrogenase-like predicted oxidoreductase